MKTLVESIFDRDLVEKDIFDDPKFKKWINRPDILWYIYYYWESDESDWLDDFGGQEWQEYKGTVDHVLNVITDCMHKVMGKNGWTWWMVNYDYYDFNNNYSRSVESAHEFAEYLDDAIGEIQLKSTDTCDGVYKTWFKGPLPKNSNVTYFMNELEIPLAKPGKVDSGIFLTNEDTIIVLAFPKGTPKDILKLFNLR